MWLNLFFHFLIPLRKKFPFAKIFFSVTFNLQLCGVVACANESVQSCAKPTVTQIAQINALELAGNFSSAHQVYPTCITKELQLLPVGNLQLNIYDGGEVGLVASRSLSETLAIGLYGRAYDKDIDGK